MNLKKIKNLVNEELKERNERKGLEEKGLSHSEYGDGYVNYETGELLFDWGFNMPCETYFHNVSDYEEYGEGTPEYSEWLGREDNWEMCGIGKFLNYPDNFVVRCRFARPSYIQVLEWFEKQWGANIDITSTKITVKNLRIPHGPDRYYIESWEYHVLQFPACSLVFLSWLTMNMIIDRFKLLAGPFKVKEVIKEIE